MEFDHGSKRHELHDVTSVKDFASVKISYRQINSPIMRVAFLTGYDRPVG